SPPAAPGASSNGPLPCASFMFGAVQLSATVSEVRATPLPPAVVVPLQLVTLPLPLTACVTMQPPPDCDGWLAGESTVMLLPSTSTGAPPTRSLLHVFEAFFERAKIGKGVGAGDRKSVV